VAGGLGSFLLRLARDNAAPAAKPDGRPVVGGGGRRLALVPRERVPTEADLAVRLGGGRAAPAVVAKGSPQRKGAAGLGGALILLRGYAKPVTPAVAPGVAPDLGGPVSLAGQVDGTSTCEGLLTTGTASSPVALEGTCAGTSTAVAVLIAPGKLVGTSAGASTCVAVLKAACVLVGACAGTSSATATLKAAAVLVGLSTGQSTALAVLTVPVALAGTCAGTSTAVGLLTVPGTPGATRRGDGLAIAIRMGM